jgi:hypothetical protein
LITPQGEAPDSDNAHAQRMEPSTYRIEIRGRLPARVLDELTDFTLEVDTQTTTLSGPLADAAALYGLIARLESLGLTLLSVHPTAHDPPWYRRR